MSSTGYLEALPKYNQDPSIAVKIMSDPIVMISMLLLFVLNISILVFCIMDGKPEENKYGPSPKYIVNNGDFQEMK